MEAERLSEKRKRSPSSFSGTITGSNDAPFSPKVRRLVRNPARLMRDLVKDLRSHRVFSPSSELYQDVANQKLGFKFGCAESEHDSKSARNGDLGFQREGPEDSDNGFRVLAEKCSEAKASDSDSNSNSKTKSFIQPCFQRKVFKNPGSVSYRRLLPYLMDISKQNTCELDMDQSLKLDNYSEGKELQAEESFQRDEASKDGPEKDGVSEECQNDQPITLQKIELDCPDESANSDKLESISSDNIAQTPCTSRADESCSNPFVDDHIQESGIKLSNPNNLDCVKSTVVKGSPIVKESVIHMPSNDDKPMSAGTKFLSKARDGDIAEASLSSTAGDTHLGNDVEQFQYSEDTKQTVCSGAMKHVKDQKCGDDGEVLNEESNQMTPPDAEIFDSFVVEGNESDGPDNVLRNGDHLPGNGSTEVNQENASLDYNTRHEFNSKCRGVLKPCSQAKLFKNPGLFSYRRMLPFIMDIAKENSDALANGQFRKLEKDSNQQVSHTTENQEIPLIESQSFGFEDKHNGIVSQMPYKSGNDELLQAREIELETATDLITMSVKPARNTERPSILSCPTNIEASSRAELATSNSGQSCSRVGLRSDRVRSTEADSSQHDYGVSSRISDREPKKGILKRNPKGCRGLCTCLNCASFRLNAERAFEFSRNQMEDTEELVLELVKELSHLRNVLKKSTERIDDTFHVSQVKEACKKASEAEELAKDRLSHMSYDLGIHCRITCVERPRVKFSDRVKEHTVPKPMENSPDREIEPLSREWTKENLNTS